MVVTAYWDTETNSEDPGWLVKTQPDDKVFAPAPYWYHLEQDAHHWEISEMIYDTLAWHTKLDLDNIEIVLPEK